MIVLLDRFSSLLLPMRNSLAQIGVVSCRDAPVGCPGNNQPSEYPKPRTSRCSITVAIPGDRPFQMHQKQIIAQLTELVRDVGPSAFFHLEAMNFSMMLFELVESAQPNAGNVHELDIRADQPHQGVNVVLVPSIRPGCANRCKSERITLQRHSEPHRLFIEKLLR
jgi:hypothetical protein